MGLTSCGLLLYRFTNTRSVGGMAGEDPPGTTAPIELLIAHMGGPFWARKDAGAWTVPKGLAESDEDDPVAVAEREFVEEMGSAPTPGEALALGSSRSGNKKILIFAREGDFDVTTLSSNEFEMEWPPKSGQLQRFPEVDRADWVTPDRARSLLVKSQGVFVDRLLEALG